MAKQTINIGTVANDKTGDQLRTAFTKINSNFTELYNGAIINNIEVEGTLELTKNDREGVVALSVTDSIDTLFLGEGQLIFEGNHPNYGIIPSNDDRYSLGNPSFGWSTVYTHAIDFSDGTTQTTANPDRLVNGLDEVVLGANGRTIFPTATVPTHSYGAVGDVAGMVAFDSTYIYYCTADYINNTTHIWKRVAWSGSTW